MPTADTDNNVLITTYDGTAIFATDYSTSGSGLSLAHLPIQKMAWGSDSQGFRVSEQYPLPVQILGVTSNYLGVTFGGITGSVFTRNAAGTYLIVGGPSGSLSGYAPVQVTGSIQGITNGILLGVTGFVNILGTPTIQGVCGGLVGITGGRRLSSSTDSVTVVGNVGLSGGLALAAANNSVAVWGSDLGNKILSRIYASDGTTLGYSGNALNVNIVNAGFTASITINPVVGVTNGNNLPLKVIGSGVTADFPILVKGTIGSGAIDVTATTPMNVGVTGTVFIYDTNLVNSLESTTKPLISNLSTINTNSGVLNTINDKLSAGSISAKINEVIKPTALYSGSKDATTTGSILTTSSIKVKSGVHIKAPLTNTATVYIGSSSLLSSSTSGFPLEPGESIYLEIDNLNKIYVLSSTTTQKINYIAS